MANAPYQKDGKWFLDIDPDDQNYVVANVTNDLTDRATTVTGVACIASGVTVLEGPQAQGSLMVAKVQAIAAAQDPHVTFRMTCANTERFDRTIWFNLEDH
jgi:hypothetical protein